MSRVLMTLRNLTTGNGYDSNMSQAEANALITELSGGLKPLGACPAKDEQGNCVCRLQIMVGSAK